MKRSVLMVTLIAVMLIVPDSAVSVPGRFARHQVKVFFSDADATDCSKTLRFTRWTSGRDVLDDALNWLSRGPRKGERADGASSWFSKKTAGMIDDVRIEDGTANVDLDDVRKIMSGASASCGSASLLANLNKTVLQFPAVDRVVYSLEGSADAFYSWLQMDSPPGNG